MVRKVILDVDTGSDDAVALMTAVLHDGVELVAACSVAGNKDIEKTTENTLRVMEALNVDVPVYRGCAEPMVKFLCQNRIPLPEYKPVMVDGKLLEMHSDYLDLPASTREPEALSAPMFYLDYLRKATEPVTIIAVGPLTNLAVALTMDPDIFRHNVEEIVIMGGGVTITNASPSAEFNIWYDPEAAEKVVQCGAKITFVPLDATHKAVITKDDCATFRELGTFSGDFAADLCEQRIAMHTATQPLYIPDAAAVHDALAVSYVIDPSVLKDVRHVCLHVGLGDYGEGQTIVDPRYFTGEKNCWFAFDGDRFRFMEILCEAFRKKQ